MPRSNPGRPPYALLPTLLIFCAVYFLAARNTNDFIRHWIGAPPDPTEIEEHIAAGIEAQRSGDTHRADDEFHHAVAIADGSASAFVTVATTLNQRDFAPPAVIDLLLPATKDKDTSWDPMIWATLADAYRRADDTARATESDANAQKAADTLTAQLTRPGTRLPLVPGDREAEARRLRELGRYDNERRNDPASAIQDLRIANALTPDRPDALAEQGYLLAEKGTTPKDRAEAVTLTQKAAKLIATLAPDSPSAGDIFDAYGWALQKNGDPDGARRVLVQATADNPTNARAHFHLGVVYASVNDATDAAIEFDRAIQLQPVFSEAADARRALPPLPPAPTPRPSPTGFSAEPPPPNIPSAAMPTTSPAPSATPPATLPAVPTVPTATPTATPVPPRTDGPPATRTAHGA